MTYTVLCFLIGYASFNEVQPRVNEGFIAQAHNEKTISLMVEISPGVETVNPVIREDADGQSSDAITCIDGWNPYEDRGMDDFNIIAGNQKIPFAEFKNNIPSPWWAWDAISSPISVTPDNKTILVSVFRTPIPLLGYFVSNANKIAIVKLNAGKQPVGNEIPISSPAIPPQSISYPAWEKNNYAVINMSTTILSPMSLYVIDVKEMKQLCALRYEGKIMTCGAIGEDILAAEMIDDHTYNIHRIIITPENQTPYQDTVIHKVSVSQHESISDLSIRNGCVFLKVKNPDQIKCIDLVRNSTSVIPIPGGSDYRQTWDNNGEWMIYWQRNAKPEVFQYDGAQITRSEEKTQKLQTMLEDLCR